MADSIEKNRRDFELKKGPKDQLIEQQQSYKIKDNNFIFESGLVILMPTKRNVHLKNSRQYADDYFYDLDLMLSRNYGFFLNFGYQCKLGKNKHFFLPIRIGYSNFSEKNRQFGEYSGGVTNGSFHGNRSINTNYQIINLGVGFGTKKILNGKGLLIAEISPNVLLGVQVYRRIDETPSNCNYCQERHESASYQDSYLFFSLNNEVSYQYSIGKITIGPMISYSFNFIKSKYLFTDSYTNFRYYNFFTLGFKIII